MGKILPEYKKVVLDEMLDNIISNTSHYYAVASNPTAYSGTAPDVTDDDYSANYHIWSMIFGKKLSNNDIIPIISKNMWAANTVYDRYDDTSTTLHETNNFYAICQPGIVGGNYNVYKCIDNANGAYSTVDPSSIGDPTSSVTFTTSPDNYKWRFITSISSKNFDKFATTDYAPCPENATVKATANNYSGIDVVVVSNGGFNYDTYHSGTLESVVNTTLMQISSNASSTPEFYTNSSIYIYNTGETTSQLRTISQYVANSRGRFIKVDSEVNAEIIVEGTTLYKISPRVVFNTDGITPKAYSTVNPYNNSISSVTMLDIGSGINRAEVSIDSSVGSGANLYPIVPPPGGHGYDPASELNMKGFCVAFSFSNTEFGKYSNSSTSTIPIDITYNKIALIKNPYEMDIDGNKGDRFWSNTFDQRFITSISPNHTFTFDDLIVGESSGARGRVVFSNGSHVGFVGDKSFEEGERILDENLTYITTSNSFVTRGDIYNKEIRPLYVQNINNVERSNTQTESFRLIIQM